MAVTAASVASAAKVGTTAKVGKATKAAKVGTAAKAEKAASAAKVGTAATVAAVVTATRASEARENFSEFLDNAVNRPGFISRRRGTFVVLPMQVIQRAVPKKIKIGFGYNNTKNGRVYYTKNEVFPDVIGRGKTKEEAMSAFTKGLLAQCRDFYENFQLFSSAPERMERILPVLKVLTILADGGDVSDMLEVCAGKK